LRDNIRSTVVNSVRVHQFVVTGDVTSAAELEFQGFVSCAMERN